MTLQLHECISCFILLPIIGHMAWALYAVNSDRFAVVAPDRCTLTLFCMNVITAAMDLLWLVSEIFAIGRPLCLWDKIRLICGSVTWTASFMVSVTVTMNCRDSMLNPPIVAFVLLVLVIAFVRMTAHQCMRAPPAGPLLSLSSLALDEPFISTTAVV